MVKPFFRGSRKKWLLSVGMVKMVMTGRLGMHVKNPLSCPDNGAISPSLPEEMRHIFM